MSEKGCVMDMKARNMSLAHGRVMKTTFEPLKGNTDTCPGTSVNNQKNHHRPRLVITRPGASVNIQHQVLPRNCITRLWASDIVKQKLVTKSVKGPRGAQKPKTTPAPGRESTADVVVDNIGFKATGSLSRISARK